LLTQFVISQKHAWCPYDKPNLGAYGKGSNIPAEQESAATCKLSSSVGRMFQGAPQAATWQTCIYIPRFVTELGTLLAICAIKTCCANILQCSRHVCLHRSKHLCWQTSNKMIILLFAYEGEFKRDARHGCITAQHCKANRYHTNSGQNHHNICQIRRMASAMQSQPLRGASSWQTLSRLCKLSFWVHKIKTIALSQL